MTKQIPQDMPKYKLRATVQALKIKYVAKNKNGSGILRFEDETFSYLLVDPRFMELYNPQEGGYYTVFEGAAPSYCGREAFDVDYAPVDSDRPESSMLHDEDEAWQAKGRPGVNLRMWAVNTVADMMGDGLVSGNIKERITLTMQQANRLMEYLPLGEIPDSAEQEGAKVQYPKYSKAWMERHGMDDPQAGSD